MKSVKMICPVCKNNVGKIYKHLIRHHGYSKARAIEKVAEMSAPKPLTEMEKMSIELCGKNLVDRLKNL